MKKNIFKTLAAALCIGAFVLTGCTNNFEGTTPDFKQKKEAQTGNFGEGIKSAKGISSVSISPTTISQAAEDTEVTVSFTSQFELDFDSVEKAFTFYKLKKNSKNEDYYPEHDGEITKTLIHVTEPSSYSGTVSFLYRLNTKDVTTSKIALVVDATKLKYKNGLAVVSSDGNLKAGEETDSFVKYITVSSKNDGTSTDTIDSWYNEDFSPQYTINSLYTGSYGTLGNELTVSDTDLTPSGKFRYYCYAPVKTRDADGNASTWDDGLADILSKKFKLQIQKPESTKWEDGSKLVFGYHTDYVSYTTNPSNPHSSNTYTTDVDTSAMAQGTKWRIVCDYSVSIGKAPDFIKDMYGHPEFVYNPKYTEVIDDGFVNYGDKDTTFIYAWGNTGVDPKPTFTKDDCDNMSAFFTQCDFVNWIGTNENNIEVNIKTWQVELDKTDGFILVDSKKTIVPSTTSVHKNADGKIDKVIITPKNDKLNLWRDSYDVYVGSGTTIKENPDYPKQVQFGCYPDLSKGPLSGYVLLAQNVVKAGTAYTTAEDWRGQTYSAWINEDNYGRTVNGNWENHFNGENKVYLIAGETYHIQFVNGYNSYRDVFLSAAQASGWRPNLCYYGQLYLIDADESTWSTQNYARVINYDDSGNVEYTPSKTGYYYICTNRDTTANLLNNHTNNGYDPITDDGYDWYYDAYCDLDGNDIMTSITNQYYDSTDVDSPQTVDVPTLFEYTFNGTADGTFTIDYTTHVMVNGSPKLNPNKCIPYCRGNVYYHIYME